VNGGNWQIENIGAATTTANTNTAADTNYHTFTVQVNAAASSVAYLIDGVAVNVSPLVANIPTSGIGPQIHFTRSAGTPTGLKIDLLLFTLALTSTRPG
jgi:hypothetical protein